MIYIIKRDGRKKKFDKFKIVDAVLAAFKSVDGTVTEYAEIKAGNIADYIQDYAENSDHELTIEEIQDLVEKGLSSTKRKDVAKEYILYRNERTRERNKNSILVRNVGEKLKASNVENQNANIDELSFGGRRGEAANVLMKQYALDYCMSEMARNNHLDNIIYTHDLDSYAVGMHNCLTLPIDPMMAEGCNTRQTDIRPANSINTFHQLLAVYDQLQSLQQFGGVSASHLDWSAVPYIRKSFRKHWQNGLRYIAFWDVPESAIEEAGLMTESDWLEYENTFGKQIDLVKTKEMPINWYPNEDDYKDIYNYAYDMTYKECMQAVEGMYHNLNTLQSRSGNQLPFTSINYGTCTLPEGRMEIECLLKGSIKGVGKFHKTPIFPCGIFQCMKGVNRKPGDPNYDLYRLALESTSKRLYPNYANVDWSGNAGYNPDDPRTYFSTMGCRTANGWDINGFGQLKDGRGNIAPVTIILPTLAMMAKEEAEENGTDIIDCFMLLLDKKLHEAKDQLIERFEYICSQPMESAKFMYENNTMAGYVPEEGIRSALKHGTLAVGQLGLAETLEILIGENQTTEKGMELAKQIEQMFKDRCRLFKETYKLNFGVYYTPKLLGLGVA